MTTPKKRITHPPKRRHRYRGINVIDPHSERSPFEQVDTSDIKQTRPVELDILIGNEWRYFHTSYEKAQRFIRFAPHRGYLIHPL